MKENQIESCQKCLLVKTYKCHKKISCADLIKKRPDGRILITDVFAAAKHKIILPWPKMKQMMSHT